MSEVSDISGRLTPEDFQSTRRMFKVKEMSYVKTLIYSDSLIRFGDILIRDHSEK